MNFSIPLPSLPVVLLACAASASCAAFQPPLKCPEHGGPTWTEVTSAHFVLKTDLNDSDAQRASKNLEDTFAALSDVGFSSEDKPKTRIDVAYFRRRESYFEFAPRTTAGAFLPSGRHDFERRPIALLGGDFDSDTRELVQHELTHLFVRYYYPQAPVWLNEGMARYLETLSVEGGTAILGRAPRSARFSAGSWRRGSGDAVLIPLTLAPSVSELHAMKPEQFYAKRGVNIHMPEGQDALEAQTAHYQGAWCFVHMLMENPAYTSAFHAYLDRLHDGEPDGSSWDGTIGDLDELPRIEADYKASLAPDEVMTLRTSYTPPPYAPERVRTMDDSEVHVLWARLRDWDSPDARAAVEADLAETRRNAQNPDFAMVQALWEAHAGQRGGAERVLRDALAAHPDDARLWSALGWLALEGNNRPTAPSPEAAFALAPIATKLAPIAKSAAEFDLLAHASLLDAKPDAALAYEKSAVAADPNCVDCLGWAAAAMLEKGMAKEALEVATLAQGLSPEGEQPRWLALLVQRARTQSGAPRSRTGSSRSLP